MAEYSGCCCDCSDSADRFYGNWYIKLAGGATENYHAASDGFALYRDSGIVVQREENSGNDSKNMRMGIVCWNNILAYDYERVFEYLSAL